MLDLTTTTKMRTRGETLLALDVLTVTIQKYRSQLCEEPVTNRVCRTSRHLPRKRQVHVIFHDLGGLPDPGHIIKPDLYNRSLFLVTHKTNRASIKSFPSMFLPSPWYTPQNRSRHVLPSISS